MEMQTLRAVSFVIIMFLMNIWDFRFDLGGLGIEIGMSFVLELD